MKVFFVAAAVLSILQQSSPYHSVLTLYIYMITNFMYCGTKQVIQSRYGLNQKCILYLSKAL